MLTVGPYSNYSSIWEAIASVVIGFAPIIGILLLILNIIMWYRIYMIIRYEYYKRK